MAAGAAPSGKGNGFTGPGVEFPVAPVDGAVVKTDLILLSLLMTSALPAAGKPNVILVLTDDQGMGDLSFYGNPVVQTPHLDKLAREGVSFDQFHVTSMCSPTRAALLTGKDSLKNGTLSTCQGLHSLRPEHPVIPEALSDAGYATGLFGKWHLGRNWPSRPEDRGFAETLTLYGYGPTGISSRWNNDYVDTGVVHNGKERQTEGFCTDAFFNEAMNWMKEQREQGRPFFTYLSLNAPHFPFWAPEEWTEPYKDTKNPEFFAMVKNIDENMGRLDAFLKAEGIYENTILLFLSDNGPVGGKSTYNAGMTGGKATPWEGGHRVPLFIRYPDGDLTGGRVVEGLTDGVDLFPTLLELTGASLPAHAELDGLSLVPAMLGEAEIPADRFRVMHIQQRELTPKNAAVMEGKWRLLWSDSLYDVEADLAQENDLAGEKARTFVRLWKEFQRYYHGHREAAVSPPGEVIGSPHQELVILDASYWLEARADGQPTVRNGAGRGHGPEGAPWKIKAYEGGTYSIALRRWPVESGLALDAGTPPFATVCSGPPLPEGKAFPIAMATLDVDGRRYHGEPGKDPTAVVFEVDLTKGDHLLQGTFRDREGHPLCGAFFAYIRKL